MAHHLLLVAHGGSQGEIVLSFTGLLAECAVGCVQLLKLLRLTGIVEVGIRVHLGE